MKNKLLLAVLLAAAAFIVGCGSPDMQNDTAVDSSDISAELVDNNIDAIDNLNLGEDTKSDYWLNYYIPSAYSYYVAPYYWGTTYPNYCWPNSAMYPYHYGWRY